MATVYYCCSTPDSQESIIVRIYIYIYRILYYAQAQDSAKIFLGCYPKTWSHLLLFPAIHFKGGTSMGSIIDHHHGLSSSIIIRKHQVWRIIDPHHHRSSSSSSSIIIIIDHHHHRSSSSSIIIIIDHHHHELTSWKSLLDHQHGL
jgi:hypothetical protein